MNITQLEYFKTVAECGSFSAAAAKLFVSQPTLSISVKKLEEELGLTLFVRNSKGFALTKAGKRMLTHAGTILDGLKEMQNEAQSLRFKKDSYLSLQSSGITMLKHFLLHYAKNNVLPPPKNFSGFRDFLFKGVAFTLKMYAESYSVAMP